MEATQKILDAQNLARITSIRIQGFRSLKDVEIDNMPAAVLLIGANGAGKSNFIRFFEMLSWMVKTRNLVEFVERHGGADSQLYRGNRVTPRMEASISLETERGTNDYNFSLTHGSPDRFFFSAERFRFSRFDLGGEAPWNELESGHREAAIIDAAQGGFDTVNQTTARVIVNLLRNCSNYQFHDTSGNSNMKKSWDVGDNLRLRSDAGNLAAVLLRLERNDISRFDLICRHIGRVLTVFDRFVIEEAYGRVQLRWKAKDSDRTYGAHLTSDGSLRFFALVTLLNLPSEMMPEVILLDEPELGLHPAAITLVGSMVREVTQQRQVIVATQSPLLADCFDLEEIVVLNLDGDETRFNRLDPRQYASWLEDYAPGELWQRNLFGGRP